MYGSQVIPVLKAFESRLYEGRNVRKARELVLKTSARIDAKRIYLPSHIPFDLWKRYVSDEAKETMAKIPFVNMHELRDWDRKDREESEESDSDTEIPGDEESRKRKRQSVGSLSEEEDVVETANVRKQKSS